MISSDNKSFVHNFRCFGLLKVLIKTTQVKYHRTNLLSHILKLTTYTLYNMKHAMLKGIVSHNNIIRFRRHSIPIRNIRSCQMTKVTKYIFWILVSKIILIRYSLKKLKTILEYYKQLNVYQFTKSV